MRRWLIILAVLVVLISALVAGTGYFGLGWWRPSRAGVSETPGETPGKPLHPCEESSLPEAMVTAREALRQIDEHVKDYSAVIVKKERSSRKIIARDTTDEDYVTTVMFAKIREKPAFSVYLHFLSRSDNALVKDREVLYVRDRNEGKLLVHTPNQIGSRFTFPLNPNDYFAMLGEHYPITEIGLANLCRQLIARGNAADDSSLVKVKRLLKSGLFFGLSALSGDPSQVKVKRFLNARIAHVRGKEVIDTRFCSLLEIIYPVREPKIESYLARVYVDDQYRFPVRVEIYELPLDHSKEPQLVEEYTYLDLKLNRGYGDLDFDKKNPQYKFP